MIFDLVTKLLRKELLDFLDLVSLDVYISGVLKIFPYKSFSETMNLVMVSMLRELVKSELGSKTIINFMWNDPLNNSL